MKCSMMLHFIWVLTVCQSTHLGVSSIQRVNIQRCLVSSVFLKRRQPAKIATYFAFCASYFDKLVHRLYYKAANLARFMTMSAGYPKTERNPYAISIAWSLTTNPSTNVRTLSPISGEISEPNCCNVVRNLFNLLSCLAPQAGGSC